jgi:protocatechuate 3,4-dioxygenase beta subunit
MNDREKDDEKTGKLLSRREVFAFLSVAAGVGALHPLELSGAFAPARIGKPEQTEGPYFIDEKLNRSDIRSDPADGSVREGVPLKIAFHVLRITSQDCTPLQGAMVDLWNCDANGIYSGVRDYNFNTVGKKFLRGCQITDVNGKADFITIYPGWYPGRTVHMHFKIRTDARSGYAFTSQLYFDDSLSDLVFAGEPYSSRSRRAMRNEDDFVFRAGGKDLMLSPVKEEQGYSAVFEIGLPLG